mgnify:CR=1 FL=1
MNTRTRWTSLFKGRITQFSPPRTGSTLVWNALKVAFPDRRIRKKHRLRRKERSRLFPQSLVCTVRAPHEAVASSCLRASDTPDDESIRQAVKIVGNAFEDLAAVHKYPNVLLLRYEAFYTHHPHIFEQLEEFFRLQLEPELKERFYEQFALDKVREKSMALGAFSRMDASDEIHGRHVSKYGGEPGTAGKVFNAAQLNFIHTELQPMYSEFGYDPPETAVPEERASSHEGSNG